MAVNVDVMLKKIYAYQNEKTGESFDLPYRVYYPSDYDAANDKKYPILFFLHGHGECGTDNELQIRVLKKEHRLINMVMERNDTVIVAPQCPCSFKHEWVLLNHAWGTGSREALTEEPTLGLAAAESLLMSFLDGGKIDLSRVYSAGISMGGYGTWALACLRAPWFAAAMPICGGGLAGMANEFGDLPIRAFHGLCDKKIDPIESLQMVKAVNRFGGQAELILYPKLAHNCWDAAYSDDKNYDWMFSFTNERGQEETEKLSVD
jgi:predicted peptidase